MGGKEKERAKIFQAKLNFWAPVSHMHHPFDLRKDHFLLIIIILSSFRCNCYGNRKSQFSSDWNRVQMWMFRVANFAYVEHIIFLRRKENFIIPFAVLLKGSNGNLISSFIHSIPFHLICFFHPFFVCHFHKFIFLRCAGAVPSIASFNMTFFGSGSLTMRGMAQLASALAEEMKW